jgi:hypothetical protein
LAIIGFLLSKILDIPIGITPPPELWLVKGAPIVYSRKLVIVPETVTPDLIKDNALIEDNSFIFIGVPKLVPPV